MNRDSQSKMNFLTKQSPDGGLRGSRPKWDFSIYRATEKKGGTNYLSISSKFVQRENILLVYDSEGRAYFDAAISTDSMGIVLTPDRAGIPADQRLRFRIDTSSGSSYRVYSRDFADAFAAQLLLPDGQKILKFTLHHIGRYNDSARYAIRVINN